jgi:hypothetical protein
MTELEIQDKIEKKVTEIKDVVTSTLSLSNIGIDDIPYIKEQIRLCLKHDSRFKDIDDFELLKELSLSPRGYKIIIVAKK